MKTIIKLTKLGVITLITFTLVSTSLQTVEARNRPTTSAKKTIKPYQLKTCIVSNEELGSMGDYHTLRLPKPGNQSLLQTLHQKIQKKSQEIPQASRLKRPRRKTK